MKKNLFSAGTAFALLVCLACEGAEGIVNAAWLNARVFPELKSPVAVKLPRNKKVEVTKRHGLWLEIAAPDITPVFASAAFLDENKVLRDINLRIRPAAGAAVIGRVRKGDTLKAVSTPDRFGWVQVAPLPEMRLYVDKDYVTYDPAQVPVARLAPAKEEKKTEKAPAPPADAKAVPATAPAPAKAAPAPAPEKAAPAPAPAPVKAAPAQAKPAPAPAKAAPVPAKPAPAPAKAAPVPAKPAPAQAKAAPAPAKPAPAKAAPAQAKKGFELTPARKAQLLALDADLKKPEKFEKNGRLVAVRRPAGECTAYALLDIIDGHSLGFVFAEAPVQLKKLENKEVAVKGVAYRVSGWRNPVVGIETVSVIGE